MALADGGCMGRRQQAELPEGVGYLSAVEDDQELAPIKVEASDEADVAIEDAPLVVPELQTLPPTARTEPKRSTLR